MGERTWKPQREPHVRDPSPRTDRSAIDAADEDQSYKLDNSSKHFPVTVSDQADYQMIPLPEGYYFGVW